VQASLFLRCCPTYALSAADCCGPKLKSVNPPHSLPLPALLQGTKKDMLKVAGWGWMALAAHNAYSEQQGDRLASPSCAAHISLLSSQMLACRQHGPACKPLGTCRQGAHESTHDCLNELLPCALLADGYSDNPTQPREVATVNAIGQGLLGALCLSKGYEW
jgi:hypothetical protein